MQKKVLEIAHKIVLKKPIKDFILFKKIFGLKNINLTSGGSASSPVSAIIEEAVQLLPPLYFQPPPSLPPRMSRATNIEITQIAKDSLEIFNSYELFAILGRTLVYRTKNSQFIALKILKQNENPEKLVYESAWFTYLNELKEKNIGLHGEYPLPFLLADKSVFKISNSDLPESIDAQIRHIDTLALAYDDGYTIMAYQTYSPDYFTYYTDITDNKTSAAALAININDLFVLAKYGFIHPDLIVLFHDKKSHREEHDSGRYLPFINIVRNMHDCGAGSLKSWQKEVQYPNLRRSGPADFAEMIHLDDLIGFDHAHSFYLKNNLQRFEIEDQKKFIYMHFLMGSYPLSIILSEGSRLKNIHQLLEQNNTELSDRLHLIFRLAFNAIADKPDSIWNNVINWEQAAQQMIFFMGDAYKKYTEAPLPLELFDVLHDKLNPGRGWGRIHGNIIKNAVQDELEETDFDKETILHLILNSYFYQELETRDDDIFYFYDEQIAELLKQETEHASKKIKKKTDLQKEIIKKIIMRLCNEYRTGWRFDGVWEDLGPINGPFPLTEIITAGYLYGLDILKELSVHNGSAMKNSSNSDSGPPFFHNH